MDDLLATEVGEKQIVVYTFGSPRVGNKIFHNHYNTIVPGDFVYQLFVRFLYLLIEYFKVNWRVVNAQG